jgi:hypothetical protein
MTTEVSMKRIILTAMALTLSGSIFAEQPQSSAVFQNDQDVLIMTSIESKNRSIMSSYDNYSQFRQQNHPHEIMIVKQQYSQFLEKKGLFSTTAGL